MTVSGHHQFIASVLYIDRRRVTFDLLKVLPMKANLIHWALANNNLGLCCRCSRGYMGVATLLEAGGRWPDHIVAVDDLLYHPRFQCIA